MLAATLALAVALDDAQLAAQEGRYHDVVTILTQLIDSAELNEQEVVVAYSNRGIAHSLLEAYGLAWQDLRHAIKLDDSHALTQNHLGILAEHVDHDYGEAFTWYRKASMQGFAASQVNLGNLYRDGKGPIGTLLKRSAGTERPQIRAIQRRMLPLAECIRTGMA